MTPDHPMNRCPGSEAMGLDRTYDEPLDVTTDENGRARSWPFFLTPSWLSLYVRAWREYQCDQCGRYHMVPMFKDRHKEKAA